MASTSTLQGRWNFPGGSHEIKIACLVVIRSFRVTHCVMGWVNPERQRSHLKEKTIKNNSENNDKSTVTVITTQDNYTSKKGRNFHYPCEWRFLPAWTMVLHQWITRLLADFGGDKKDC